MTALKPVRLTFLLFVAAAYTAAECALAFTAGQIQQNAYKQYQMNSDMQFVNDFANSPLQYKRRIGPYAPIGRLDIAFSANDPRSSSGQAEMFSGTAFLVSPCYIYTARHVVFGNVDKPNVNDGAGVRFSAGEGLGRTFKHPQIIATPVLWTELGGVAVPENPGLQMTLLRLEKCVGEELGWVDMRPGIFEDLPAGRGLQVAGFAEGRDFEQLSVADNCGHQGRVKSRIGNDVFNGLYHNCSARPGMSGAPLFFVEDGVPQVVGSHVRERRLMQESGLVSRRHYSLAYANVAEDLTLRQREVWAYLRADLRRFGRPNPLAQGQTLQRELDQIARWARTK